MAETKKLTINIASDLHGEIQRTAEERGITITELIRRAIALDKFVWDHRDAELLVKNGEDVRQIVLI